MQKWGCDWSEYDNNAINYKMHAFFAATYNAPRGVHFVSLCTIKYYSHNKNKDCLTKLNLI